MGSAQEWRYVAGLAVATARETTSCNGGDTGAYFVSYFANLINLAKWLRNAGISINPDRFDCARWQSFWWAIASDYGMKGNET